MNKIDVLTVPAIPYYHPTSNDPTYPATATWTGSHETYGKPTVYPSSSKVYGYAPASTKSGYASTADYWYSEESMPTSTQQGYAPTPDSWYSEESMPTSTPSWYAPPLEYWHSEESMPSYQFTYTASNGYEKRAEAETTSAPASTTYACNPAHQVCVAHPVE